MIGLQLLVTIYMLLVTQQDKSALSLLAFCEFVRLVF